MTSEASEGCRAAHGKGRSAPNAAISRPRGLSAAESGLGKEDAVLGWLPLVVQKGPGGRAGVKLGSD